MVGSVVVTMLTRSSVLFVALSILASCSPPIEIIVDEAGVTHVYGQTDVDAWYGAGYQTAADRLFQMEMLRRFARGQLSEVLGEAGLLRDKQARIFDFPRWGQADLEATQDADPERAELISAWVAGINARIAEVESGDVPAPFGFRADQFDFVPEPWSEVDPYIILKGAGFALDKTLEFEIAMSLVYLLYPDAFAALLPFQPAHPVWGVPPEDQPTQVAAFYGPDQPESITPLLWDGPINKTMLDWPRPVGSNNWAVQGRFTANGRPLIAGDPHLGFDFFGAPYPLHVNSKDGRGTYNVAGFAFPGTPGIALGHNDAVAWTCTSAFADVMDVWSVTRVDGGVQVGDEVLPLTTRIESILVRDPGSPMGEGTTVVETFEEVEGVGVLLPIELLPIPFGDYLVVWTGFEGRPARWFMELNRVADLDEFEAAVGRMEEMNYSFVAADAGGIAYRVGVSVPDRPDVAGPRAPWKSMDGNDAGSLWTGERLDDRRMPHGRAAERGWIATANNDPFGFTDDGNIANDEWYYGAFFAPGYRAHRIQEELERLTARGDLTLEDMQDMQRDLHSSLADTLVPLLADALSHVGSDPDLASFESRDDVALLVELITNWDREMARESAGALAFHSWARHVAEATLADDLGLAWGFAIDLKPLFMMKIATMALAGDFPDASPVLQEGRDTILLSSAARTADWLTGRFGGVDAEFKWSDLKVTSLDHAYGFGLELFSVETDGGEDTINVAQDITFAPDAERWVTSYVSVERTVSRFRDDGTPEAWVNFPLAGAADPNSEATAAALEDYVEGRYRRVLFERAEIDSHAVDRLEIQRLAP
jgi:penicillin amidase